MAMIASTSRAAAAQPAAPRLARSTGNSRSSPRRATTRLQAVKLYTNPGSRGKIAEWVLAELQVPHEVVLLDMRKGEHKTSSYLAINPFGKVPAMTDGDLKLFESGAILLHLADKYGKLTGDQRARAYQWTLFANSTMSTAFFNNRREMPDMLGPLEKIFFHQEYLEGSDFSVSDIAVGSYLLYLPLFFPDMFTSGGFTDKYPSVWQYMKRLAERETCPDAYKEGVVRVMQTMAPASQQQGNPLANLFKKR